MNTSFDWRLIQSFLAVLEHGSLLGAARALQSSQPTMGRHIADLEAQLGVVLFERTTRRVQLTSAGERLLPLARRTVGEFDAGLQRMHELSERETQRLAMAALPSLASALLPDMCADVEQRFPDAHITVHDGSMEAALRRVEDYAVDFALAYASPAHGSLQFEEIARDRFVLLAAGALGQRIVERPMHLIDLVGLPIISMTNASTAMKFVSAAFLQQGIEFTPRYQLDQVGSIASFVRRGLGIALLPYLGVAPLSSLRGLRLAPLQDAPIRAIGIVSRKSSAPSAIAQVAMQSARERAARLVADHTAWLLPPRR